MKKILTHIKHTYRVTKATIRESVKSRKRSPLWDKVRDAHVLQNPVCAACGSNKRLQVHHIQPFHLNPELELDPNNFISLCMDIHECHLNLGHGDNFKCYNPDIKKHCFLFLSASEDDRLKIIQEAREVRKTL